MSHLSSGVLSIMIATSGCSSPKPPASSGPEEPLVPAPAVVTVPVTPADVPPPALSEAPSGAAPKPSVEPVIQTLFVRERLADCQDEGARKCLQVREAEADEWRNFYGSIEGFDYDESYAYQLRVEAVSDPNPPADGASLRYRLLEVIAKRQVSPTDSPR